MCLSFSLEVRLGPVCPVDCGLPQSDVLSACIALSTGFDVSAHSSDVCGWSLRRGQGHVAVRTWSLRLWRWSVLGSFKALRALGGLLFVPGVAALEPGSGSRDLSLSKRVFPAAALVPRTLCSWRPRVGLGGPLGARVAMAGAVGWGVCWGPLPLQLLPAALSDVSRSLGGAAQPLVTQSMWPLRPAWRGRGGWGLDGTSGAVETVRPLWPRACRWRRVRLALPPAALPGPRLPTLRGCFRGATGTAGPGQWGPTAALSPARAQDGGLGGRPVLPAVPSPQADPGDAPSLAGVHCVCVILWEPRGPLADCPTRWLSSGLTFAFLCLHRGVCAAAAGS